MNLNNQTKKEKVKYCKLLIVVTFIVIFLIAIYFVTSILLSIYLKPNNPNYLVGFGYSVPILLLLIPFLILFIIMYINNYRNWDNEHKALTFDSEDHIIQSKIYKRLKWLPIYIIFLRKKYGKIL